jgi:hypothetical protein
VPPLIQKRRHTCGKVPAENPNGEQANLQN